MLMATSASSLTMFAFPPATTPPDELAPRGAHRPGDATRQLQKYTPRTRKFRTGKSGRLGIERARRGPRRPRPVTRPGLRFDNPFGRCRYAAAAELRKRSRNKDLMRRSRPARRLARSWRRNGWVGPSASSIRCRTEFGRAFSGVLCGSTVVSRPSCSWSQPVCPAIITSSIERLFLP